MCSIDSLQFEVVSTVTSLVFHCYIYFGLAAVYIKPYNSKTNKRLTSRRMKRTIKNINMQRHDETYRYVSVGLNPLVISKSREMPLV